MDKHQHFLKRSWTMTVFCVGAAMMPQSSLAGPGAMTGVKAMQLDAIMKSGQSCEECHEKATPRIYREHMEGEHGRTGVSCADCHGNDHRAMLPATARSACEQCHPDETEQFLASSHSRSWEDMQGKPRYGRQPEVIRRQGCEACHLIGHGEDDGRCDFCHTKHRFSKKEAADPQSCYACHMGPDHPQMGAYRQSAHHFTPATCAACHLPEHNHNASENLDRLSRDYVEIECRKCHEEAFIQQWREGAAILEEQGRKFLATGRSIINMLSDKGCLYPDPRSRPVDSYEGHEPVLYAHQLHEDTSRAEKLYFAMHKYLQQHTAQVAYHQDFRMAAHEGLIPLQKCLDELQAEARFLQELAAEKVQITPVKGPVPEADPGDIYRLSYESSFHGILANDRQKPSCETCHATGEYHKTETKEWAPVCGDCHVTSQVENFIRDLVAIKEYAGTLRHSADETVEKLISKKIIARDGSGNLQLLDDYKQNQEVAEALLARLVYYLGNLDRSRKTMTIGVAHVNPDYTHWYGNGPARSDLIEIRDAATKLTRMKKAYLSDSWPAIGPLPQEY